MGKSSTYVLLSHTDQEVALHSPETMQTWTNVLAIKYNITAVTAISRHLMTQPLETLAHSNADCLRITTNSKLSKLGRTDYTDLGCCTKTVINSQFLSLVFNYH